MIELALVGRGRWGSNYLTEVQKISDAEIKYVVTRNYRELLDHDDIDGIIIASPNATHAEIARTFPDKYLLIEKPFATSLADATSVQNQKIMVGHTYLYNLALMEQLRAIRQIRYFGFRLNNIRKAEGTTPLWNLAPHGISLCVYFFGEPAGISAWEVNENLFVKLDYENTTCVIEVGCNYPTKERAIVALGNGVVYFDDTSKQLISPLENELRAFIEFIKGGGCHTGLDHAITVQRVLEKINILLDN